MFKVGDPIRRCSNAVAGAPIGFETVVVKASADVGPDRVWYKSLLGGSVHGDINSFELIQEGPVRTVTRQEIIPGMYDGVSVTDHAEYLEVRYFMGNPTPDELERAAAVLTALAGALRDGK